MSETDDESQSAVKTYVPSHQKDIWKDDAANLDMSLSEFVRSMVQAGRRGFSENGVQPDSPSPNPRGDGLERHILDSLQNGERTFGEIANDLEDELDSAINRLVNENRIQVNHRNGTYTVNGDRDGD